MPEQYESDSEVDNADVKKKMSKAEAVAYWKKFTWKSPEHITKVTHGSGQEDSDARQ